MPNFTVCAVRLKILTKMIGFTTLDIITLFHYPVNNGKVNKVVIKPIIEKASFSC